MKQNIFERMRAGEPVLPDDPEYALYCEALQTARRLVNELNTKCHTDDEIRSILSQLMKQDIDPTVRMFPPFYTAFGRFTTLGKNVFINFGCTFLDIGTITIEDGVFIGPNVNIVTENHPEEPEYRHNVYARPIRICRNAWIGAGAIILPGVTVGQNAIVGAGSVVTKDVADNTIVVGSPARFIRYIKGSEDPRKVSVE